MENIERIRTAINRNGTALQMEIDHDHRTVRKGYFLYISAPSDTVVNKMKLHQIFDSLTQEQAYKAI